MPKIKRDRITSTQFDTALLEEITHCRTLNVPTNSVSSAASFTLMVRKRLYGADCKLTEATNAALSRLIADAKAERAQHEIEERERQKQAQRRVILPGDQRFRN